MTNYYTLIHKSHHCPMWDIDLNITAKYRIDDDKPFVGHYCFCTCPILSNLKKPLQDQDKQFELYRFCTMSEECLHSIHFKRDIDIRKG